MFHVTSNASRSNSTVLLATLLIVTLAGSPGVALGQSGPAGPDTFLPRMDEVTPPPALFEDENASELEPTVLSRGPLHEAFAEPTLQDPQPNAVIPRRPPEPIQELPPEARPDDDDAVWINGYWAWDDEEERFIWISGIWRVVPPGREWVPGYWYEDEAGSRWVSGFWGEDGQSELNIVAAPPESLDRGPSSPPPAADHFWIPGCWVYDQNAYLWQAGYWAPYRPGWVWEPARYVWTPAGCIFQRGYWDRAFNLRGMVFAPIYCPPRLHLATWRYTPRCPLRIANLSFHLFYHTRRHHYCFGDYYRPRYAGYPILPWYVAHRRRYCYDPVLNYLQLHHRLRGVDYIHRAERWHDHLVRHREYRPPRHYRDQALLVARNPGRPYLKETLLATSLKEELAVARAPGSRDRLVRLDAQARETIRSQATRRNAAVVSARRSADESLARAKRAGPPDRSVERSPKRVPDQRGKIRLPEIARTSAKGRVDLPNPRRTPVPDPPTTTVVGRAPRFDASRLPAAGRPEATPSRSARSDRSQRPSVRPSRETPELDRRVDREERIDRRGTASSHHAVRPGQHPCPAPHVCPTVLVAGRPGTYAPAEPTRRVAVENPDAAAAESGKAATDRGSANFSHSPRRGAPHATFPSAFAAHSNAAYDGAEIREDHAADADAPIFRPTTNAVAIDDRTSAAQACPLGTGRSESTPCCAFASQPHTTVPSHFPATTRTLSKTTDPADPAPCKPQDQQGSLTRPPHPRPCWSG